MHGDQNEAAECLSVAWCPLPGLALAAESLIRCCGRPPRPLPHSLVVFARAFGTWFGGDSKTEHVVGKGRSSETESLDASALKPSPS